MSAVPGSIAALNAALSRSNAAAHQRTHKPDLNVQRVTFAEAQMREAVSLVQTRVHVNGDRAHRRWRDLGLSAELIQAAMRGYIVRRDQRELRDLLLRHGAAMVIQEAFRRGIGRRLAIRALPLQHGAAASIQAAGQGMVARSYSRLLRRSALLDGAAVSIQAAFHGRAGRTRWRLGRLVEHGAAVCMQAAVRGFLTRSRGAAEVAAAAAAAEAAAAAA